MNQDFLKLIGVEKSFGNVKVLKDINLEIKKGEFVSILGPSGCGKTTLLRIIAGLESSDCGDILLENQNISQFPASKRQFGIVFQSYALFPNLTTTQNVSYGLKKSKYSKSEIKDMVHDVLNLVGIEDQAKKYPSQLSGGQQQRVALARVLVMSPRMLLLDEPLSALDAKVRDQLRFQIRELQQKLGITAIMVTHDQEEALTMSDRIAVMNKGSVDQFDTPQNIYDSPSNQYVADFIGSMNFIKDAEHDKVKAVRPEHIKIALDTKLQSNMGKLINSEFRGSFYRLKFYLEKQEQFINTDVSSYEFKARNLENGQTVPLHFTNYVEY